MRINKYIAAATGMSRRKADEALTHGRVFLNGQRATPGAEARDDDNVTLDGLRIRKQRQVLTILFNKPTGYVVSRDGQGSRTIYDILPSTYNQLKPVGRLDKYSSGLLVLTNDGDLAHRLTHPSFQKKKVYEITLNKPLQAPDRDLISGPGVQLDDGPSRLLLEPMRNSDNKNWRITMHEGRNRQIRRTFATLNYAVTRLHRTHFGPYHLQNIPTGDSVIIDQKT